MPIVTKMNCKIQVVSSRRRTPGGKFRYIIDGVTYESLQEAADGAGVSARTILRWCDGYIRNGAMVLPDPNCTKVSK